MIRINKLMLFMALPMLLLGSCRKDEIEPVHTPAINVSSSALVPNTDESGTVRAYIGTEVTAKGLNLDNVGRVTLDGIDCEIVEKTFKELVFVVPSMEKPQQDNPHKVFLQVYDADCKTVIFKYDYFVTVPVTDARVSGFEPKTGTVGTELVVSGRNLEQVTKVTVGEVTIEKSDFAELAASFVKVTVPAIAASEASKELEINVFWGENVIDVTETEKFVLKTPVFAASDVKTARIGDEITLNGENLDLVSAVKWDVYSLLVTEQYAEAITVKFPSSIEKADPVLVTKDIVAEYGEPVQTVVAAGDFILDTTPVGPAAPVFVSAAPSDASYDRMYLNREVTVKGENLASVEGFEIDGIEVAVEGTATDVEAKFIMPKTISGTVAKDVPLVMLYNGGNRVECGIIRVYPFYYTKGLKIGVGSNSASTYHQDGRDMSFLLLNEGRVISAQEWVEGSVDTFAAGNSSNEVIASANKVKGTEEQYYSVQPYYFLTTSSGNKLAFQNPANSASQLKTHRYPGNTSVSSTFGTPLVFGKILYDEPEVKSAVAAGALEDILMSASNAGASAPACGAAETKDAWNKGTVIMLQYVSYEQAKVGKPTAPEHVRRQGYIHITDVTCADENGATVTDRSGYVEFDLYWSNDIN